MPRMYPATVRRQIVLWLRSGEPVAVVAADTGICYCIYAGQAQRKPGPSARIPRRRWLFGTRRMDLGDPSKAIPSMTTFERSVLKGPRAVPPESYPRPAGRVHSPNQSSMLNAPVGQSATASSIMAR